MDKTYLTDYTESIEEFSQAFEFLVANAKVRAKAKSEGFYSTGQGIVSKNFYIGNNLTVGLISIEVKYSDSIILSIPKNGRYKATLSKKVTKTFSPNRGGIILPTPYIIYEAITNQVDDLIIIIDLKKLKPIFRKNYNYDAETISTSFISLQLKNEKVLSVVNFIKSTLETAMKFPHLRTSLLLKSNIEEISALYMADLIAEALKIPYHVKYSSPDSKLVAKAEELMQENPAEYFTIREIANSTFTTPRNLQLAFKKHRPYPPMHFLKERKLHGARKLILNSQSDSTIKSIVLSAGILDINRFSKQYKQLFGGITF